MSASCTALVFTITHIAARTPTYIVHVYTTLCASALARWVGVGIDARGILYFRAHGSARECGGERARCERAGASGAESEWREGVRAL